MSFSQELTIKGTITDMQNRSIQSASVSLLDENDDILGYNFTDENGNYVITFVKTTTSFLKIEISCLGYQKISKSVSLSAFIHNFMLEEKAETLDEVVVEANKKIRIEQDTTYIKVASFGNKTEQTVEDILKKLPGIEVLKDGTIKAHGKYIDKLLVEGDDMFDKNYKLLSKNLDSKVLDEVQIIDNFEDNPVLKKLNNSDKVAINLKLKKGLKNVWFGNVTVGSGIISENRWKESLNLGLIKKKIKLFYLCDYNNLGEKATDLISSNIIDKTTFSDDRFEYKAKTIYNVPNNEVQFFSKTQSVFNNAFLNSLSLTTKLKKNTSLKAITYIAEDKQSQNSFSQTKYNLENNIIVFTENNLYTNKKIVASTELELKHVPNEKNYITNLFIFKNNTDKIRNNLLFNTNQINQHSTIDNYTFYNHFNYTFQLSENKILNSYSYFGNDKINEKITIKSPLLNDFMGINDNEIIKQNTNNKLLFAGLKLKLITKFKKADVTNSIQIEYNKEKLNNVFLSENQSIAMYDGTIELKKFNIFQDNTFRYNFTKKIDITAQLNIQKTEFNNNENENSIFIINPAVYINIKKTGFGNFSLTFSENSTLPEINQLNKKNQLTDYRSFSKGTDYKKPLKNQTTSFNYYYYNDEKRFSINTSLLYINSKSIINTSSNLTENFNFNSHIQTNGSKSYNYNFSFVNYIRKLKLSSKIETTNTWVSSPINVNTTEFLNSKNYINVIKYLGTTYFNSFINFDFGFSYNYFQTNFQNIKTRNITKEAFLNIICKISKTLLVESNNSIYFLNNQKYTFANVIISHTPEKNKFSYRLLINNLINENEYTQVLIDNYSYYQSNIQLVPKYVLGTIKYRF